MLNQEYIEYLHAGYPQLPIDERYMEGYSDDEIQKIERLYDIKITGQLYDFLSNIGRCSGNLFGDTPLVFYRNSKLVRSAVIFQMGLREELDNIGRHDLSDHKAFFISVEGYTQYHFVLTASENPDLVYNYDENEDIVEVTQWHLTDYLRGVVAVYMDNCQFSEPYYGRGELILI